MAITVRRKTLCSTISGLKKELHWVHTKDGWAEAKRIIEQHSLSWIEAYFKVMFQFQLAQNLTLTINKQGSLISINGPLPNTPVVLRAVPELFSTKINERNQLRKQTELRNFYAYLIPVDRLEECANTLRTSFFPNEMSSEQLCDILKSDRTGKFLAFIFSLLKAERELEDNTSARFRLCLFTHKVVEIEGEKSSVKDLGNEEHIAPILPSSLHKDIPESPPNKKGKTGNPEEPESQAAIISPAEEQTHEETRADDDTANSANIKDEIEEEETNEPAPHNEEDTDSETKRLLDSIDI